MIINYIIVDASEFLKNAAVEKINREHNRINKMQEEADDGDDNYDFKDFKAPGHILFTSGKMFESEIKDQLHGDDLYDNVIWGITSTIESSGNVQIYLHYSIIFNESIIESLENANIYYDTDSCFGDLVIFVDEENENDVMGWLQDFPSFIEMSNEYKQLMNNINKWQKVFGNQDSPLV